MAQRAPRLLRVAVVGHVDHGKSTLAGRLLHETGSLPAGRLEEVEAACREGGKPFEYAFLLDALEEERAQGVTIDTAQVWLRRPGRAVTLFDAPGHVEFVKNMVCGAAAADAALVVIDAREGVREQSRRHGHLLRFLRVAQVAVVVGKMDLVGWDETRFARVSGEYRSFLSGLGVVPGAFVPVSARHGDHVTRRGANMPWYRGPTVLEVIDGFAAAPSRADRPLRFPVQDVYKFDDRRIIAGRVESGRVRVGDRLLFSPSNRSGIVRSIERWRAPASGTAEAGESIGLTLEEPVFVERGEIASREEDPPLVTDVFRAKVFWMGRRPLARGRRYTLRLLTREVPCEVESVDRVLDAATLAPVQGDPGEVPRNETAEITVRTGRPVALDAYDTDPRCGRFVLVDDHDVRGGGTVGPVAYPDQRGALHPTVVSANIAWEKGIVTAADRARRAGHGGAVVWMTGLSGAGKSTLAKLLEQRLFERGLRTYRLDGDNLRHGLNADLGFSPDDRAENIRRVAEVANLFADAGTIVITAFISPYRSDRKRAREIVRAGRFVEVFVACPLETCEARDAKGLYRKARAGEIEAFTGVSAPYEEPVSPEIRVDTEKSAPGEVVDRILARLRDLGVVGE